MTDVTPPPAPQSPAVPAAASTEVADGRAGREEEQRRRRLRVSLLAILAVIADIAIFVFARRDHRLSVINNFDCRNFDFGPTIVAGLGAFAFIAVVGFFGGDRRWPCSRCCSASSRS